MTDECFAMISNVERTIKILATSICTQSVSKHVGCAESKQTMLEAGTKEPKLLLLATLSCKNSLAPHLFLNILNILKSLTNLCCVMLVNTSSW